ncbi:DUF3817 domain-containing protein [Bacillus alkalicellulosilyticus]|uniref:DUF3817 domain-containing protein n=1 Tax=Alkalihalobacterium alkalicellulosilyticum TaxID=1912214 RepID=UPI001FE46F70|nr:DUF3817 domain-containing protein [Bacillus alkalicellulosilyticus]
MAKHVDRFRAIAFLEAISFLLLLGIAMPLKYLFDFPMAVTVVGAAHGALYTIYMIAVLFMVFIAKWRFKKVFIASIAALIPFGPFIFDNYLLGDLEEKTSNQEVPQ